MIGSSIIIPGVSGALIAVMLGLYDKIVEALSDLFSKKNVIFLLPFCIGGILGAILSLMLLFYLLPIIPFSLSMLFAGFVIGSVPKLREYAKQGKSFLLQLTGFIIPVSICIFANKFIGNVNLINDNILFYLIVGTIISCIEYIPGASASVFLMSIGLYKSLIVNFNIVSYLFLGLGFIIGFFVFARLVNKMLICLNDLKKSLFYGLALGSFVSFFINPDIMAVYKSWQISFNYIDFSLGIIFLISGALIIYKINVNSIDSN